MIHLTYYQTVASFLIVFLSKTINTTVVLEENGYSNIVVAISEETEQPDDGGLAIIASITVRLRFLLRLPINEKTQIMTSSKNR